MSEEKPYTCQHQIMGTWRSTADQMGLISPAPDGNMYSYMRECEIMGCSAVEYAENVEPVGKRIIAGREVLKKIRGYAFSPPPTKIRK